MSSLRISHRKGIDGLELATTLLQRIRASHPTWGLYEAADLQWWWRTPRPRTDDLSQIFWLDDRGLPGAAVIATDWGDRIALNPHVMPGSARDWISHVMGSGIEYAEQQGFNALSLEVDKADEGLISLLTRNRFVPEGDGVVECWLAATSRPAVSSLDNRYRLLCREETKPRLHHLIERNGATVEERLCQTSLYRPDLDLVVYDERNGPSAYGLFWFDPETSTGLVEPMRTNEEHQRRGLACHILTEGIRRLVKAGAERIKICFEPDNAAAKQLYTSVGFEPHRYTAVFVRPSDA